MLVLFCCLWVSVISNQIKASDQTNSHGSHEKSGPDAHGEVGPHQQHGGHAKFQYHVFHVEFERVEIPFIIALWIFVSSLAKIGFHMTPKLHHIFPESCLLIVIGIIIGFLLFLTSEHPPSTLTPDVFFLFMLPPIILDAGYFMPNRLFFDHLGTILLMAVVGTIFNVLTIGTALWAVGQTGLYGEHDTPGILETFLFSSLISAVDPVAVLAVFEEIGVNEILYIVVFGESLLNDAITVVLYHMFEAYVEIEEQNLHYTDIAKGFASFIVVAGGGTIIGIIWGYITGFVTRFTNHATILEPLFVFTMAYLSYLTAEIFHMSGILAITFCGITMKNYVERNVSSKSQTTIKYGMKMLSSSSETIIFMFLGVATIHDEHDWNWWFVILTILFCTVFRCIGVLILSGIANRYRLHKLGAVDQFVMMYGGLRGAVAFALVLLIDKKKVPHAPMFVTTTIAMVYWTVFVQGITIKPLVKFLNVKTATEKEPTMNERITGRFMDHIISGMEGILGEFGNLKVRDMYRELDIKYIKPCLLRENKVRDPKILETYEIITSNEMEQYIKMKPSNFHMKSDSHLNTSVSQIFQNTGPIENVDLQTLNYNQSMKSMTEAKIHHLLVDKNQKLPGTPTQEKTAGYKYTQELKKRKKKTDKDRISGVEKTLEDEHIHEYISANVNYTVRDTEPETEYLSFNTTTTEDVESEFPWRKHSVAHGGISAEQEEPHTPERRYTAKGKRPSISEVFAEGIDEDRLKQIHDLEFLDALELSDRKVSSASAWRKMGQSKPQAVLEEVVLEHPPKTNFGYEEEK
jgi:sodium/hydrogen exchanger-like protein 3